MSKTDQCPFCGGTRHLMTFSAWCQDCDTQQVLPEIQDLRDNIRSFVDALSGVAPFRIICKLVAVNDADTERNDVDTMSQQE